MSKVSDLAICVACRAYGKNDTVLSFYKGFMPFGKYWRLISWNADAMLRKRARLRAKSLWKWTGAIFRSALRVARMETSIGWAIFIAVTSVSTSIYGWFLAPKAIRLCVLSARGRLNMKSNCLAVMILVSIYGDMRWCFHKNLGTLDLYKELWLSRRLDWRNFVTISKRAKTRGEYAYE